MGWGGFTCPGGGTICNNFLTMEINFEELQDHGSQVVCPQTDSPCQMTSHSHMIESNHKSNHKWMDHERKYMTTHIFV